MSDDFEEGRIFLELCYFTVSLISDSLSPIQYFKSDFVVLMQPIIKKFIQQFPSPNEHQILTSALYRKLVSTYVLKIKPLILALKQSGLWIPQGSGPQSTDATEMISSVLESEVFDVEQILILRSVHTNQLIYSPELTIYFNACFLCLQSPIAIVRIYSYSLLRSAPIIIDLRHLFNVFKYAVSIWDKGPVSFEFAAALYLLLTRFSSHRTSPVDEAEYNLILQLIENLSDSVNFEILMCFDPSLKWMFNSFPKNSIQKMCDRLISPHHEKHYYDFCIYCRCLSIGTGDTTKFYDALKHINNVNRWAQPIRKETRHNLSFIPLSASKAITSLVIDFIVQSLDKELQEAESVLYIFTDFLISYYLETNSNLNLKLLTSLLTLLHKNESKKSLITDIQNIIIAICSNPVRFIHIIYGMQMTDIQSLLSLIKQFKKWGNSLLNIIISPKSFPLISKEIVTSLIKEMIEKSLKIDEKNVFDFYPKIFIDLPLYISLHPTELQKLLENMSYDEDYNYKIIELFYIVVHQGKSRDKIRELISFLPETNYICEYTNLINLIKEKINEEKSLLELTMLSIDDSVSKFLIVGSNENIALSLLFEHIVYSERKDVFVIFKRLKLSPSLWFSSMVSSLFTSIVKNFEKSLNNVIKEFSNKSPVFLALIGYILFSRIVPSIRECLVREKFDDLPTILFCPLIEFIITKEEEKIMMDFKEKYDSALDMFYEVLNKFKITKSAP